MNWRLLSQIDDDFGVINSRVKTVRIDEHINHRLLSPAFIFSWASWFFDFDFANHVYTHIYIYLYIYLYICLCINVGSFGNFLFFYTFLFFLLVILLDPCSCSCCSIATSPDWGEMIGSLDRSWLRSELRYSIHVLF